MNYLGVDFGTSNCVAAHVGTTGEVELIPLENNQKILPTVVFAPRKEVANTPIAPAEFQRRLRQAEIDDQVQIRKEFAEFAQEMDGYDRKNKPSPPAPPRKPKREDYQSTTEFETDFASYTTYVSRYPTLRRDYEAELEKFWPKREEYERQHPAFLRRARTTEELEAMVKRVMQREAVDAAEQAYWDQTFFDALRNTIDFEFGSEAINTYTSDPLSGFFLRSPKAFLGTDLKADHVEAFTRVIAAILQHIKRQAETHCRCVFDGIVLGRPVNYQGSSVKAGNQQALNIMRDAAIRAGFEVVRFFLEPSAASLTLGKQSLSVDDRVLIIDVGGGTTDCVFFEWLDGITRQLRVLSFAGDRVGGSDFDQSLAWHAFMPLFGKDQLLKDGLPIPHSILHDAISTRDVPAQIRFGHAAYRIERLIGDARDPAPLTRLLSLQQNQLQYKLLMTAERVKILLSDLDNYTALLNFVESGLSIDCDHQHLQQASAQPIGAIERILGQAIELAGIQPTKVFVTGGMSKSVELSASLTRFFGPAFPINPLPSLTAVGQGLGIVAGALSTKANDVIAMQYEALGLDV
jgi:hypothetical chaperone protein